MRVAAVAADPQVQRQDAADGHHVVQHRRPHVGTELPAGVEDLAQHGVEAVEEHLWQAPERKRHGKRAGGRVPFVGPVDQRHQRGQDDDEHRDSGQCHQRDGEQPVQERLPAILVLGCAGDLGDQHGVEQPTGDQVVNRVGHRVRGRESVEGQRTRDAQQAGEQDRTDEAEQSRDECAGGHHGAGAQQRLVAHG